MSYTERIEHEARLIALIIRSGYHESGTKAFSNPGPPLQLTIQVRKAGQSSPPHIHPPSGMSKIEDQYRHEIIHLEEGEVEVSLYTRDGEFITKIILHEGDTILITEGHGLVSLTDSKIISVKEGPYLGLEADKILLN